MRLRRTGRRPDAVPPAQTHLRPTNPPSTRPRAQQRGHGGNESRHAPLSTGSLTFCKRFPSQPKTLAPTRGACRHQGEPACHQLAQDHHGAEVASARPTGPCRAPPARRPVHSCHHPIPHPAASPSDCWHPARTRQRHAAPARVRPTAHGSPPPGPSSRGQHAAQDARHGALLVAAYLAAGRIARRKLLERAAAAAATTTIDRPAPHARPCIPNHALGCTLGAPWQKVLALWQQPGIPLGAPWGTVRALREHPGDAAGTTWGHTGSTLGQLWEHPRSIQRPAPAVCVS